MRSYFIGNPQSSFFETDQFQNTLAYVSTEGKNIGLSLKQSTSFLIMIKDNVKNMKEARIILERILEEVESAQKTETTTK